MKYKIIRRTFHSQDTLTVLCCLNCDKPMLRICNEIKMGKQFGDDGWYCLNCSFFFFERKDIMYYCEVSYDRITDTFIRFKTEYFAIFLKDKKVFIE